MGFVCTLDEDGTEYAEFRRSAELGAQSLTIPVGYDDETNRSYNLFITLGPSVGGYDELAFCLLEYDEEAGAAYEIWSAQEAAHKIPREDRARILNVLINGVVLFATVRKPAKVYMCTFEPTPDGAPLRKYLMIANAFQSVGYRISMPDVYHGQRSWRMERD